jgi:hypothetical protein
LPGIKSVIEAYCKVLEVKKGKRTKAKNMRIIKTRATKVLTTMIATGLMAGTAFAGGGNSDSPYTAGSNTINVTLPEAVAVGGKVLPRGQYKISEVTFGTESMFMLRDDNGNTAAVLEATRTVSRKVNFSGADEKTELFLSSSEDGTFHLSQLFIEGQGTGFQFVNLK